MTEPSHPHKHDHDHAHGHDGAHDHDHGQGHSLEGYHVHGGAPALDIGGDIGAMVATMDRTALGTELHLRSEHEPPLSVHTGVWERQQGDNTVVAAVFAELVEGTYLVLDRTGEAVQRVEVEGGKVATIDLRA
ncbi:MAG: hypothetical protein M3455_03730 [Actinomycetota bacterium]|nr:hypothetical protein [Actinomycetota bacterium]